MDGSNSSTGTIALNGASGDAYFLGKVGIGKKIPVYTLDVSGSIAATHWIFDAWANPYITGLALIPYLTIANAGAYFLANINSYLMSWPTGITGATWANWTNWTNWIDWVTWAIWATGASGGWIGATGAIWATGATWANWTNWIDWATWAIWATGASGGWIGATWAIWATGASGGWTGSGVPGGIAWSVQFNDWTNFSGGNDLFWHMANKRLGIGTNTPSQRLEVNGNMRFTASYFIEAGNNDNQLYLGTNGNVGIGTSTPTDNKLQIAWNITSNWFIWRWNWVTANGLQSTAMWVNTKASADYSTAMWYGTVTSAMFSTAMWLNTTGNGVVSTAMGWKTQAYGQSSTAMWESTRANGDQSTAMWLSTQANGNISTAMWHATQANGNFSTAMWYFTVASGWYATAIWAYNIWLSNSIFEIGIGTGNLNRVNAMTVLFNGNVGIGTSTPTTKLDVDGGMKAKTLTADPCLSDSVNYPEWTLFYNGVDSIYCYCWNTVTAMQVHEPMNDCFL